MRDKDVIYKKWSKEEINFIINNRNLSVGEIAEKLDRSFHSVRCKMYALDKDKHNYLEADLTDYNKKMFLNFLYRIKKNIGDRKNICVNMEELRKSFEAYKRDKEVALFH